MFLFFWSSPARLFWSNKIFNIRETCYLLLKIKCFQLLVKFLLIIVVIRIQRRHTCTQEGPELENGGFSLMVATVEGSHPTFYYRIFTLLLTTALAEIELL